MGYHSPLIVGEDDEKAKEMIDARNNFEGLVYQMKSTLSDEKLSSMIDSELKTELEKVIEENTQWLDSNKMASKEEYESRTKDLQEKMKPLQEKMMGGTGMSGAHAMPDDLPKTNPSDETTHGTPGFVDDVD